MTDKIKYDMPSFEGLFPVEYPDRLAKFMETVGQVGGRVVLAEDGADIVYIFAVASRKEPVLTAGEIGVKDSAWELFAEKPLTRKKKKFFRVYRHFLR